MQSIVIQHFHTIACETHPSSEFMNNLLLSVCRGRCPGLRRVKAKEVVYASRRCSEMLTEWKEKKEGREGLE